MRCNGLTTLLYPALQYFQYSPAKTKANLMKFPLQVYNTIYVYIHVRVRVKKDENWTYSTIWKRVMHLLLYSQALDPAVKCGLQYHILYKN